MNDALKSEVGAIKGTVAPEVKWLKDPFVGKIEIKDFILSENEKGKGGQGPYTGSPFFKYKIRTQSKEDAFIVFWRVTDQDDEKKAAGKREKLKKFLDNAGADPAIEDPIAYLKSVIGKKLHAVMKIQEEFVTDQGVPRIATRLVYSYSDKLDKPIVITDISKLIIKLSPADQKAFDEAVAQYEASAGQSAPTEKLAASSEAESASPEDDLPF